MNPLPDRHMEHIEQARLAKAAAGSGLPAPAAAMPVVDPGLLDFYAYLPAHQYIYVPTGEVWPAPSVNGRYAWPLVDGKRVKPSAWLDRFRPVEQMVWDPEEGLLVCDRVMQQGGYMAHPGAVLFNLYRAPEIPAGNAALAGPWLEHLARIYPAEQDHILRYLACKLQRPGTKINHALVLGGAQGIGKDTLLEPVKAGVGPWNWHEISPTQMLGRFNGWSKAVMLRISEARDLGEVDRFGFYDHSKTYLAAPPDVVRVDEKHLREHYVRNVCGVIITTNHKTDGLYLPADDRRHFVAWSETGRDAFGADYWRRLYGWYADGGAGHVIAHLRTLDLAGFDPKAPPPRTPAFWTVVHAGEPAETGELRDALEHCGSPDAVTLGRIIAAAEELKLFGLADEFKDRKLRRSVPHKLERVGYVPVRNPEAPVDGLFRIAGRRLAVYARRELTLSQQLDAARSISAGALKS